MKEWDSKEISIKSFNNAINGIIYGLKKEIKLKVHLFIAIFTIIFSLIIDISKFEIITIIIMISLVISLELVNTAIENIVDFISPEYNEKAKIIKDLSSGAVFISAIGSLAIAYLIFYDRILLIYFSGDNFFKLFGRIGHITIIIIFIVIILVICLKTYFNKGTALEGGMPSGHAALSFSLLPIIFILTKDVKIYVLVTILALLVAQSRVKSKIHTVYEVIIGASLGFIISTIILLITYKIIK